VIAANGRTLFAACDETATVERLFLGLRGPMLSGRAIVVELRVKVSKPGRLKLRRCGGEARRYSKHFLPLDGLGIRDLRFDGDDLLVPAGPTMSHDGVGALFRWRSPLGASGDRIHGPEAIERLMDLPYAHGRDQAEGIAFVEENGTRRLLVVYDSPSPARLTEDGGGLIADLFDVPP
jgi:hypothetical protein